jgi:hypothetical protein
MSLDAYKALDLSMGGALAKSLLSEVDREASSTSITLSSRHTASKNRPTFVTPAMSQWFSSSIITVRDAALDEILKGFKDIELARGQKGFLPEAEKERIELDKYREIEKERDRFFANGNVHRLDADLEALTLDYEHKKAQQAQRDAEEWSPWPYTFVLTLLALPEFPLNVAGFLNLGTFITGAMAYALTGAVAVGIGFSSHIIGESTKQYRARFGRGVIWEEKFSHLRYLSLGTVLFVVAMGIVTTVRYIYFKEQLSEAVFGGGSSSPDYMTVFGTVGGNFLIWLIGVGVAYVAHDVVPGYGKLRRRMKKLQAKLDDLYAKELQRRIDQKKAKAQDEENLLVMRENRELANRPDYAEARNKFDQFRAVDATIEAIFGAYRSRLGEKIRAGKAAVEFCYVEIELPRRDITRKIDFPTYELQRMELRYGG